MVKKLLTLIVFSVLAFNLQGQTIVSTAPENKNVILEEFTGINCVYCPAGHAIANSIKANNPDDFFIINVHQGGFATPGAGQPDFRTPFGNAIVAQSYSGAGFGYPSGTVNRQNFPGREMTAPGTTAMGRNFWTISSNEAIAQSSYVNLGVEATIDVNTRLLTVHVEAYYTGNSPVSTNKLNVALLQNNTLGPQTGGGMGNNYRHMHRLVHLLTGQWGVDVNTTTTGSFVDQTFTYTIPADYNGVPVDFFEAELEVVVFMTETQQTIISGNGTYSTYTGLTLNNDISLNSVEELIDQCDNRVSPEITIQNLGNNTLTSLEIEYSINGGAVQTYNWTGNLTPLLLQTIILPEIEYNLQPTNLLEINVADDDNNTNNTLTLNFNQSDLESTGQLDLVIQTDGYGSEVRWNIKNSEGTTLYQGGPYGNNQIYTIPLVLEEDCYTFTLIDTYGDGGGPVSLTDYEGTVIYSTNGAYGSGAILNFGSNGVLGIADNQLGNIVLYPNPSEGIFTLKGNSNLVNIIVYNVTGKRVFSQNGISDAQQIDISFLQKGMYLAKISNENAEQTQKLIIK